MNKPKVAVVGGGAAGFFLSICLKERLPEAEVTIFERSQKVLAKVVYYHVLGVGVKLD